MIKLIYLILLPVAMGSFLPRNIIQGKVNLMNKGPQKLQQVFTFHTVGATFEDAKKICAKEGGRLAVVSSRAVENTLVSMFQSSGPLSSVTWPLQAFIGLQYNIAKYQWQTLDGKPATYVNWSQNWAGGRQPSNPAIQSCGSLLKQGAMDDVGCYAKLAFFCEKLPEEPCDCDI